MQSKCLVFLPISHVELFIVIQIRIRLSATIKAGSEIVCWHRHFLHGAFRFIFDHAPSFRELLLLMDLSEWATSNLVEVEYIVAHSLIKIEQQAVSHHDYTEMFILHNCHCRCWCRHHRFLFSSFVFSPPLQTHLWFAPCSTSRAMLDSLIRGQIWWTDRSNHKLHHMSRTDIGLWQDQLQRSHHLSSNKHAVILKWFWNVYAPDAIGACVKLLSFSSRWYRAADGHEVIHVVWSIFVDVVEDWQIGISGNTFFDDFGVSAFPCFSIALLCVVFSVVDLLEDNSKMLWWYLRAVWR